MNVLDAALAASIGTLWFIIGWFLVLTFDLMRGGRF